jgi:hypothetical protein
MRYQVINFICFLLIPFCLISCIALGSGEGSECEMANCSSRNEKKYADVKLTDSTAKWLSFCPLNTTIPTVQFKNAAGFSLDYTVTKKRTNEDKDISRTYKAEKCCSQVAYIKYYMFESEEMTYNPKNGGVKITFNRKMNPSVFVNDKDSMVINSLSEYLLLRPGSASYAINTDSTYADSKQLFHPQLSLRGKNFSSVFEIIDTTADTVKIVQKGFYYSFSNGLIGYYLTNGELWLKE